jgi:hypothetical protein
VVKLSLALQRVVMGDRGLGLRNLGLEHIELPRRILKRGRVARDGGSRRGDARGRLLRVLYASVAGGCELRIALVLLLCEGQVRLVDRNRRPRRIDDGLLRGQLCEDQRPGPAP